jgi:hypothetical protein
MTKTKFKQERMPLTRLAEHGRYNGGHVCCDYCTADAVYYHFADRRVNRDAYACAAHMRFLNPSYR